MDVTKNNLAVWLAQADGWTQLTDGTFACSYKSLLIAVDDADLIEKAKGYGLLEDELIDVTVLGKCLIAKGDMISMVERTGFKLSAYTRCENSTEQFENLLRLKSKSR